MVKKQAADLKQNLNVASRKVQQVLNTAKTSPKPTPSNVHPIPKKVQQAAKPVVQKSPIPTSIPTTKTTSKGNTPQKLPQKKVQQQQPQSGKAKTISTSKVPPSPPVKEKNVIPGVSFGIYAQIQLN